MIREHFEVGESAITLIGPAECMAAAKEAVFRARDSILRRIAEEPYFHTSFEPLPYEGGDRTIERMSTAAAAAGVGPMASVAGTVAWEAVEAMASAGASLALADNGGDIAMVCDRTVTVGIHSGGPLAGLGLSIPPRSEVLGICSSSARVGPSISLGESHVCTVISEDVSLADACATSLGNMVRNDDEDHLKECLQSVLDIPGIIAAMANVGEKLAIVGDMPRLVGVKGSEDLITKRTLTV